MLRFGKFGKRDFVSEMSYFCRGDWDSC